MTEPIDMELEARIVASLDGRLSPAEQAGLDRQILRDPAARALMERYRDADRRAAEALDAALGSAPARTMPVAAHARGEAALRWRHGALIAAATALLAVGLWVALRPGPTTPTPGTPRVGVTSRPPPRDRESVAPESKLWVHDTAEAAPMIDLPRRGDRVIDRQYFGAFDEDKREFYLWEVDRVRMRVENASHDL